MEWKERQMMNTFGICFWLSKGRRSVIVSHFSLTHTHFPSSSSPRPTPYLRC